MRQDTDTGISGLSLCTKHQNAVTAVYGNPSSLGMSSSCVARVHLLFFSLYPQYESIQVRCSVPLVKENITFGLSQHAGGN